MKFVPHLQIYTSALTRAVFVFEIKRSKGGHLEANKIALFPARTNEKEIKLELRLLLNQSKLLVYFPKKRGHCIAESLE